MLIRAGYELILGVNVPTAMTAMLKVHPSRTADLRTPQAVMTSPALATRDYIDQFGNICTRMVLPPGDTVLSCDVVVEDSGQLDPQYLGALQHPVDDVPNDALIYLLGSQYCETDRMSALACSLSGMSSRAGGVSRRSSTMRTSGSNTATSMPMTRRYIVRALDFDLLRRHPRKRWSRNPRCGWACRCRLDRYKPISGLRRRIAATRAISASCPRPGPTVPDPVGDSVWRRGQGKHGR